MGKRGGKKKYNHQTDVIKKKVKKDQVWRDHKEIHENSYFRKYYQMQFQSYFSNNKNQFETFWDSMKIRLPVVFRINPNQPNYLNFQKKLLNQSFLATKILQQKVQGQFQPQSIPKLQQIQWYPKNIAYTLNTNKQIFKKSKMLSSLHSYIQKASDSGLITRQELVSMLPPLYLDVKSSDIILDMCAAPGSKTSQLLQYLYSNDKNGVKGCVVANDVQYNRAKMLIHQVQRAGTAGMAVINHNGQFLPQLYTHRHGTIKQKFLYDKVLCDVPCSGDGATRKLPNKWSNWHSNDGMVLHPLQLNLLIKGINMLKPGGLLLYSTCSLNPIEDQAVVLQLMRRVKFGLKIVDIHGKYGVKGRRGLTNWKVCVSKGMEHKATQLKQKQQQLFIIHENYESAKDNYKVKKTMFPQTQEIMKNYGIQNTMRLLPHDQNSGGFFLALFQKEKEFSWVYKEQKKPKNQQQQEQQINEIMEAVQQNVGRQQEQVIQQKQVAVIQQQQISKQQLKEINNEIKQVEKKQQNNKHQNNKPQKINRRPPNKNDQFDKIQLDEFKSIQSFYGIIDDQFQQLLYVRKQEDCRKKVTLVSQGVSKLLIADSLHKLKLINMGCKAFQKAKQTFSGAQCQYRLCQDGIHYILPLITKRKIRISLQLFQKLIVKIAIKHIQIQNQQQRKKIGEISQGSFVLYIQQQLFGVKVIDALVGQNFKNSMNLMISKQELQSLKIRYIQI